MTRNTTDHPIECDNLGRGYTSRKLLGQTKKKVAIEGLGLEVSKGIVFGLLGLNGAGKTTVVRILSTLLTPTSGEARIMEWTWRRTPTKSDAPSASCWEAKKDSTEDSPAWRIFSISTASTS